MEDIQCALIGYGGIAEFHAEAIEQLDGAVIKTIVGRREEPTRAFAEKHGASHATIDLDEALADDSIDAVIVTSPSELHFDQTSRALEAGKHVLVEIPIAMSHKGARTLAGLAGEVDRKVLVAHTRRFDDVGRFTKDFISSGNTGVIYQHHAISCWHRHENVGWTGYNRSWTDDVLFHHGCHSVDFSLWTIGSEIRRVSGELAPLHPFNKTSMDFSMLMRYTNETIATVSLSYNAHQPFRANRYTCENGSLELEGKLVRFNGDVVFETPDNPEGGVLLQDCEFFDAIREDREPSCNAGDALRALRPLQQVYDQMIVAETVEKYERPWEL
jgi:2-hydroxy-4-carboxymuconate semialdehyde hemiacetal dehydrogenase